MKHPKSYDSTPETRKRMSNVKLKGGKAETLLAKALWHQGYRYRKNDKRLPGSPDIAILKYHIAVFVDGEFWHGKDWETRKTRLKRNREYWIEKIEENMARDFRNDQLLTQAGWMPIHFWEKEVMKNLPACIAEIEGVISMEPIRTVELFAGVGGFRLGLEAASDRFQIVWANQWEPSMREQYAFECYTAHFGSGNHHVCQDIAKVKADVPDHDLLVGGFPCQDYSIMKKNSAGIEGSKGVLWWQIDDILREKRPKYVLLENVDRIIRSPAKQCGRDFSIILRCLYEKGYAVEWRVINAADYGYAQRRRRTFIVAYHNQTERFQNLAEGVCTLGLKHMHRYIMENAVLTKAFPVIGHSRTYTESWVDEMVYPDILDVSQQQRANFYSAGVMMNGHIYSVDVRPQYQPSIPLSWYSKVVTPLSKVV